MVLDAAGLRVLTRDECLGRLRGVVVGRIALSHRALPTILPVRFRLDDLERIVIATTPGLTLHRSTDGTVVAFEADGPAGVVEPTWSVVVHGLARHVEADADRARIEIFTDEVTGREVVGSQPGSGPERTFAPTGRRGGRGS